jgi:hypothetical protein
MSEQTWLGKQPLHSSKRHTIAIQSHAVAPKQHLLRSQTKARFLPCPRDHSEDQWPPASRTAVSTSLLRYFFEEKVINSPAPVHQWYGMAICQRRARVVLPSCTTHAAAESVEQAAMLQVRGGMSEVITSHIVTDRKLCS